MSVSLAAWLTLFIFVATLGMFGYAVALVYLSKQNESAALTWTGRSFLGLLLALGFSSATVVKARAAERTIAEMPAPVRCSAPAVQVPAFPTVETNDLTPPRSPRGRP